VIDTPFSRFADQNGLAYGDVLDCFNWLSDLHSNKRPAAWDTMTVPARELLIIMIGPAIDRRKLVELRTWPIGGPLRQVGARGQALEA
jgi:hypothetical protein